MVRLSLIADYGSEKALEDLLFLWRENYGAFRAEVVVFNHPLTGPREQSCSYSGGAARVVSDRERNRHKARPIPIST
jgi:hypothetical protein